MSSRRAWFDGSCRCSLRITIAFTIVFSGLLTARSYGQENSFGENTFEEDAIVRQVFGWRNRPQWMQGLSISGFLQNNTGVLENSRAFAKGMRVKSKNSLSSQRDWAQIDVNYDAPEGRIFGQNWVNRFFLRIWTVYEPQYDIDQASQEARKARYQNSIGVGPGKQLLGTRSLFTKRSNDDFHNQYQPREIWGSSKLGPLTLFVGRQIVTWGESVSFRVADVLNPQDTSFGFGFANLEQSRLPRYMIHPFLKVPNLGPLSSNFVEVVYMPGFDPLWTQVDYIDGRFDGQNARAGRVSVGPFPGTRFAGLPETRVQPGAGGPGAWWFRGAQFNPVRWSIPAATFANSDVGVRLHTIIRDFELTALYVYSHEQAATPFFLPAAGLVTPNTPPKPRAAKEDTVQNFQFRRLNGFGVTVNRPLYLPAAALSNIPVVLRAEMFYSNHAPFQTTSQAQLNGVKFSDTLTSLVALDLSQIYVGWISRTAPVLARVEWFNSTVLDKPNDLVEPGCAGGCLTPLHKNESNVLTQIGAAWWNNDINFMWTSIWNPDGNTLRMFPTLVLTPPWTNKYFLTVRWIGIQGSDRFAGLAGGRLKGHDQFNFTFQYNFDLL